MSEWSAHCVRCVRCHREFTAVGEEPEDDLWRRAWALFEAHVHECSREFEPDPDELMYADC